MPSRRPQGGPSHSHPQHPHPPSYDTSRPQTSFHAEFDGAWPARPPRRPNCPRASRGQSEPPPDAALWKDLPALPSNYRLGEGLPWDLGAEPAADPDDLAILPYTRPTVVLIEPLASVESAESAESLVSALGRREDPQRKRNLEDLSAAMMTVDNGFEGQWWNRGHKVPTVATAAVESMAMTPVETPAPYGTPSLFTAPAPPPPPTQPSLGWAVAAPAAARQSVPLPSHRPAFAPSPVSPETHARLCTCNFPAVAHHDLHERRDMVSPESESASVVAQRSDGSHHLRSSFRSSMRRRQRSSEELFLTTGYSA